MGARPFISRTLIPYIIGKGPKCFATWQKLRFPGIKIGFAPPNRHPSCSSSACFFFILWKTLRDFATEFHHCVLRAAGHLCAFGHQRFANGKSRIRTLVYLISSALPKVENLLIKRRVRAFVRPDFITFLVGFSYTDGDDNFNGCVHSFRCAPLFASKAL